MHGLIHIPRPLRQRMGHENRCGPTAPSHRVPLGLPPSLYWLRSRSPGLFAGFVATMGESDFSRPCVIGYNLVGLSDADRPISGRPVREISRFSRKERLCMPGPLTSRSRRRARDGARRRVAFRLCDSVGAPDYFHLAPKFRRIFRAYGLITSFSLIRTILAGDPDGQMADGQTRR